MILRCAAGNNKLLYHRSKNTHIDVQREDDLITGLGARDERWVVNQSIIVTNGNIECCGGNGKDRKKGKSNEFHDAQHTLEDEKALGFCIQRPANGFD
jgi:hypothetical protein